MELHYGDEVIYQNQESYLVRAVAMPDVVVLASSEIPLDEPVAVNVLVIMNPQEMVEPVWKKVEIDYSNAGKADNEGVMCEP